MIVMTAPTSTIGRDLVPRLLAAGAELRLVTRDASRLDADVAARAEVVVGSHGDPEVIDRACAGAEAVFWLVPGDGSAATVEEGYVGFTRPAVAAFTRHGVRRVVGISAVGRGSVQAKDAGPVTASLAMDDLIASCGVAYRAVVCPSFMHNLLGQVLSLRQGWFSGMGEADLAVPMVATADIAAVAAGLLLDQAWAGTGFAEVPVLGPEELSMRERAGVLGAVLGRQVAYRQVSAADFAARMAGFGMSSEMAAAMVAMFEAKNLGMDNVLARTAETASPTTFRRWCEEVLKPAVED